MKDTTLKVKQYTEQEIDAAWKEALSQAHLINLIIHNYKYIRGQLDYTDLRQEVYIAVFKAMLMRYNPEKGTKRAFLDHVIRGCILDVIRRHSIQKRYRKRLEATITSFDPHDETTQIQDHRQGADPTTIIEDLTLWCETAKERRRTLHLRERIVLWLYYYEHLPMYEISNIFGLSDAAISRDINKSLYLLESYYNKRQNRQRKQEVIECLR